MKEIRVVKVESVENGLVSITEQKIRPSLEEYYKQIGCTTIDMTGTTMPGIAMIIDDEGRFKDNAPTVFSLMHEYPMMGTVLFVRTDPEEGSDISLTDDDLKLLLNLDKGLVIANKTPYQVIII